MMACKVTPPPTTDVEIGVKTQELLRLILAHEYRFASRLAGIIADDLATLATEAGQSDEPVRDDDCIPKCE